MTRFLPIIGFVCLGLFIILLADPLVSLFNSTDENPIGRITKIDGRVRIKKNSDHRWSLLNSQQNIFLLEQIETHKGQVTFKLNSGYEITLEEQSRGFFEPYLYKGQNTILFVLLKGRFTLLNEGQENQFFVSYDGQVQNPKKQILSNPIPSLEIKAEDTSLFPDPLANANPQDRLRVQVSEALKTNQPLFSRCYTNLLKTQPSAKGQVVLQFSIQPDGRLSQITIQNSTLQSTDLHQCLITTLSRIQVSPFTGEPILANYPIRFE